MTKFEIYAFILCLVVFVMLVCVFGYALIVIVKQELKLIRAGLEDESIVKEFNKRRAQWQIKFAKAMNIICNVLLCLAWSAIFLLTLYINSTQNVYFDDVPTYRVVMTSSMETKNEKNEYLFENNLNDQIGAFDLIATYKIPKEEDLALYDIVVYEVDGTLIVHRIVGIEEPNASHPNERYFLLQGDAVSSADRYPVRYSQMQGIYTGKKIPFIGSFVLFMQSPAGWLCMGLMFVSLLVTPLLKKKIAKVREERYDMIGFYY